MDRRSFAVWTVLVGLLIGCLGTLVFYGKALGLSLPLFTLAVVGAVLISGRVARQRVNLRNLWLLVPIVFFAAMAAVRADMGLIALNILAILSLGSLAVYYLYHKDALDGDTFGQYLGHSALASFMIGFTPLIQAFDALRWIREQRPMQSKNTVSIVRGLMFTVPLLVVFVVLLSSADAVFSSYFEKIFDLFRFDALEDLFDQSVVIFVLGWLGCGALAYAVARFIPAESEDTAKPATAHSQNGAAHEDNGFDPADDFSPGMPVPALAGAGEGAPQVAAAPVKAHPLQTAPAARPKPAKKHPFTLGMIEATMMLGAVDLLFGVFVLIQFAYFFGGQANISVEGLTYAQYARRGFFELVAVSVLTLGVVLWLDWVTVRHTQKQHRLFRGMAVAMVALTGVMLFSASQRMSLYEAAYGFTHLRVYTHVFMFWLAVLFGVFLLSLFRVRERIFSLGTLLVIIGYLVTLNVMNVEGTIAQRNIERYFDAAGEHEIDICYLRTLSLDALPAMLTLYHAPDTEPHIKRHVSLWLDGQIDSMDSHTGDDTLFSYNAARAYAAAQLEPLRGNLYPYGEWGDENYPYCDSWSDWTRYD